MKNNKKWLIPVIIIALLAVIIIMVTKKSEKQAVVMPTITVTDQTISTIQLSQAVKVYGPQMDKDFIYTAKGYPAPCQPEFFDPKISKFYKVKQDGTPSELYKIEGFQDDIDDGVMMIDGWYEEGENKVILPAPFSVTIYNFGCDSSFSYVIDLIKDGNRQALYTHVLHYAFSEDGKKLYLINNVNNQGTWTQHFRIIDIETKEVNELPANIECVTAVDGFWQGDRLLTYSEDTNKSDYQTDICIWDSSANLISRIGATTVWGAASRNFLAEKIGLLPTDPDIFYAYTSKDENTCSLFLANIINGITKSIDILDKRSYPQNYFYFCAYPDIEFDFSDLYFDHGVLKYRMMKDEALTSEEKTWSDWQTIILE